MHSFNDNERIIDATFSAVINGSDALIHVIDRNFIVLEYNEACRKWLRKLNLDENVYGKQVFEMFPFLPVDVVQSQYQQVFDTGNPLTTTDNEIEIDGVLYYNNTIKIPVKEGDRVVRVVTIVSELTELKKTREALHESLEKLKIVFDNIEDLVFIIDQSGILIQTNSAVLKQLGYSEMELVGKNIRELHPIEEREAITQKLKNGLGKSKTSNILPFLTKTGVNIPYETRVTKAKWGKDNIYIAIARDVSERVLMESLHNVQYDFALKLSDIRDLEEVYKICLDAALKAGKLDSGGIYVFLPSGDLQLVHHFGLSSMFVEKKAYFNASSKSVKIVLDGVPVYLPYEQVTADALYIAEGLTAAAIIPVKYQGKVIACLNVASHVNKDVLLESRHVLETIAIQIGIGISRVMAENELREQKELYQTLVSEITDELFVYQTNPDGGSGKIITVNDVTCKKLGYTREELLSLEMPQIEAPESTVDVYKIAEEIKSGKNVLFEQTHIAKGGTRIPVEINSRIFNFKGQTLVMSICRDITDRKRGELAIQKAQKQLQDILDNTPLLIYAKDLEGHIIITNHAIESLFGRPREELIGKTGYDFFSTKIADTFHENDMQVVKNRIPVQFEEEAEEADGKHIFNSIKFPLFDNAGKIYAVCGISSDITASKKSEEILRDNEEKFSTAFEKNPSLLTITKMVDGQILEASQGFLHALGYSREEIVGKTTIELGIIDPDVRAPLVEKFGREGFVKEYELYIHRRNGEKLYGLLSAEKLEFKGNKCMLIVMLDTTARKLALDALHESEILYRATIDSIDHSIHVIDKDRKIIAINSEFERWAKKVGIDTNVLGKTPLEAFPFLSNKVNAEYDIVFTTGKPVITEEENIVNTEDIYTETRKLPVFDGNVVNRVVTSVEDITIRKKAEIAIRKRLEIEALLARVSTDFINLEQERFDEAVQRVLNNFRELLDVDRFTVSIANDNKTRFGKIIQSCIPGVEPTIAKVDLLQLNEFSPFQGLFMTGKVFSFDDIASSVSGSSLGILTSFYRNLGTKSLLIAPMISRGQLLGLTTFSMTRHTRVWNEEDKFVLRMVGEIIANALVYMYQSGSLKESEEKNRGLIDTSPNYIFLLKGGQTIVDCNQLASTLFKTPASSLRGKNIMDLGRDIGINVEDLRSMFLKIGAGEDIGPVEIEVQVPYNPNKKVWLELKISGLKIREKQYLQIVGNDITKQKHAEHLVNEELNKLKMLDRMRTEFIYRASHELKTPLSAVCGASALLSNYSADLTEEEMDLVNMVIKGGDRLRQLIESLVDSFRIEGNSLQLKKERINLVNTIQSVVQQHAYFIKQRRHHLSLRLPVVLIADVDNARIEAVINNLLINAINNTPPGGDISIQLSLLENQIELRIADTGIGITPEEKQRLFTKFGKIERYGKGIDVISEGTGLGLYISKNVIELHGGSIRVESEGRDKGSTFIVTLPVEKRG